MKTIEVDDELYRYIASQTQHIGESASDILRRLLMMPDQTVETLQHDVVMPVRPKGIVVSKDAGNVVHTDRVKEMRSLLISDEFAAQEKAIGRFMLVLSSLYRIDPQGFTEAAAIKGRTRVYFADSAETLLASGKTTKPKSIPETPFWVITNTNTDRKRQMIEQLMVKMRFGSDIIEKVCGEI
ncbi:replication initiation negative regulator SeqA [Photobacterium aphoticum]|uniref:Negative modulator of initiation of replication n=1 Tax=Photobacterium aphoticum TaxID=754436 RepID=A0A090QUE5_9GAMM|nr:replication initiation negative regulator SeqA [Photobacterium aphoticum]KLV00053.1 replication initiation regulator SeqA [Photobacterium aphoticum]PSU58521.1 replication initiation negative regulator SeqA [Photobacterium aphoticum]GAL05459.1 SeqA protein [Photobacterium aphoticum]